jgi:hypothetical protein
MASVSVPGVDSWGNLYPLLILGAIGLSSYYGDGLGVPFLFGRIGLLVWRTT